MKKAVITVIGKDNVGILHKVSGICAQYHANVIEVTQSVLQDMFAMIMMIDITSLSVDFSELTDKMNDLGNEIGLSIHTMHEDIFNSMHKI
jgi:ACT domain-containing protein